jgi:general stress protein CsbA
MMLLSAHFYRAGFIVLVVILFASLFLLFIRQSWIVRVIQVELVIGGLEWFRTTYNLVMMRQSMNMPWTRLAIILGSVALLTFCSSLVFRSKFLKKRYSMD